MQLYYSGMKNQPKQSGALDGGKQVRIVAELHGNAHSRQ
jgi:hypothetical protein